MKLMKEAIRNNFMAEAIKRLDKRDEEIRKSFLKNNEEKR